MDKINIKQQKPTQNISSTPPRSLFQQPIALLLISVLLLTIGSWWAFKQSPQLDVYSPPSIQNKLLYPIETNAFHRLAKISSDLNDVFALANSKKVWAVGDKGLIIHSEDGGISWQKQGFPAETSKSVKQLPEQSLLNILINNAQAMDISEDNKIYSSKQSRQSNTSIPVISTKNKSPQKTKPVQLESLNTVQSKIVKPDKTEKLPPPLPDLLNIFFIDDHFGWAVGTNGTILNTQDGGISWLKQSSDSSATLYSVYFSDQLHGWAVGNTGTILNTQDGGINWLKQSSNTSARLQAIHFNDRLQGWAAGSSGTILNSQDGGLHWIKQPSNSRALLFDIHFADKLQGWAVGDFGTILSSQDGGLNWHKQSSSSSKTPNLTAIHFSDKQHGWVVGDSGIILFTQDGGLSWLKQSSGSEELLTAVHFSDKRQGWTVGIYGTILNTQDGGLNWHKQSSGRSEDINAIHFSDRQRGLAAGNYGSILKTQDGGLSWLRQNANFSEHLNAMYFSDKNRGWAVGDNGTILNTQDGGVNWIKQNSNTSKWIIAVHFSDQLHGWAVGQSGTILSTKDGGINWIKQNPESSQWLTAVYFSDQLHGWAAGDNGTILNTQDGGLNWFKQSSGTTMGLAAIQFFDQLHGWVLGDNGTILNTRDGGLSWNKQSSGSSSDLTDIYFSDKQKIWVTGDSGTILNTQDGGSSWLKQTSGSSETLYGIYFSDTQNGWVVGSLNTILKTNNGGKNWFPPAYKKYPAGWYYILCALALFLGYRAFKIPQQNPDNQETITDLLASDRPLQSGDPDPLGFNEIAQGLSRFLRNPRTEPPLTLAITGPWGSGKSSLMNLLFDDLKQHGFSTVWFNAWHHQKSEQLLASLFANIRSQAIPGWFAFNNFCPSGLIFRLRLLKHRSSKHLLLLMLVVFSISAIAAFIFSGNGQINEVKIFIDHQLSNLSNQVKVITGIFTSITTFTALLFGLSKTMQSFALNPIKLMTVNHGVGQKMASVDPGARYQFAKEFKNVTTSLDLGRMIIFIDDLDRCGKDNVLELLEAINFLVSSGDCYIILGMAPEWVKICVGLGFKELAEESYAELSNEQQTDPAEHRRYFATQYLEKMINIEIPVPVLDKEKAQLLTLPEKPQVMLTAYDTIYHNFVQFFNLNKPWIALLVFSIWGIFIGKEYLKLPTFEQPKPQVLAEWPANDLSLLSTFEDKQLINILQSKKTTKDNNISKTKELQWSLTVNPKALKKGVIIQSLANGNIDLTLKQIDKKSTDASTASKSTNNSVKKSIFDPSPVDNNSTDFVSSAENTISWPQYIPFFASVILLFTGLALLFRKPDRIIEDSKSFRDAMALWQPYLFLSKQSPRTIKRFLNHLRYIAMRYRPAEEPDSLWATLQGASTKKPVAPEQFSEPALVALSTLHYIHDSWVSDPHKFALVDQLKFTDLVKDLSFDSESKNSETQLITELTKTVQSHKALFAVESLASETQRDMFLKAQGIRVSNKKTAPV